jgi:hypothetical protein
MDDYPAGDDIPDPIDYQHDELMGFLADNHDMRETARNSLKQGVWAGGGAVSGGLLLGPVGGLVGGILGSIVGFLRADEYDGAVQQLLQLSPHRKTLLVRSVQTVLTSAGATVSQFQSPTLFRAALLQFVSQQQVRDQIWRACVDAMHAPENVE